MYSCGSRKAVVKKQNKKIVEQELVVNSEKKDIIIKKKTLTNFEKIQKYVNRYGSFASQEMKTYGIPASITLAQGILESGMGFGRLAIEANNHFGIKCHMSWKGKRIYHDDDSKGECFRVYKDPLTSYRDHSLFLVERERYEFLFDINPKDYKAWAKGLKKAGYATDPLYPDKLISLIERFNLTRYDVKNSNRSILKTIKNNELAIIIHTVKKGDTLYSLSKQYNISLNNIVEINKIIDKTIYLGQELKIPIKN